MLSLKSILYKRKNIHYPSFLFIFTYYVQSFFRFLKSFTLSFDSMKFDILFFSPPLPSFYKVNLFNRISKRKSIFVIFLPPVRQSLSLDFVSLVLTFYSLMLCCPIHLFRSVLLSCL